MKAWQGQVTRWLHGVERRFDRLRERFPRRGRDPLKIEVYRGYGTAERFYLKGRVLEDEGLRPSQDGDLIWRNLINTYRRFESDEIAGARLLIRFQDRTTEIITDEEGYFEVWLQPEQPLPVGQMWHEVAVELDPQGLGNASALAGVQATGRVLVPPPPARFGVISDIDDTVIQTGVTSVWRLARTILLDNARARLPFPGVAAFYHALRAGATGNEGNPLFYVSSSPWNLYDLLTEFFQVQGIDDEPVLILRDWGISATAVAPLGHHDHKPGAIHQLLDLYPHLPFILIGDSGQKDPEIYHEVVHAYPGRILAVYIRHASPDAARPAAIQALAEEVLAAGSALILADTTLPLVQHAAGKGWIAAGALMAIQGQ